MIYSYTKILDATYMTSSRKNSSICHGGQYDIGHKTNIISQEELH